MEKNKEQEIQPTFSSEAIQQPELTVQPKKGFFRRNKLLIGICLTVIVLGSVYIYSHIQTRTEKADLTNIRLTVSPSPKLSDSESVASVQIKYTAEIPKKMNGEYFKSEGGNAVVQYNEEIDTVTRIAEFSGFESENIANSNFIISKKRNALIINYTKGITILDIKTGKFKDIYPSLNYKAEDLLTDMSMSPDEKYIAFGIWGSGIVIINLENGTHFEYSSEQRKKTLQEEWLVSPKFWHGNNDVFIQGLFEGGPVWRKLNIQTGKIISSAIAGLPSPDGSKTVDVDRLSPYGDCYVYKPKDLNIYWFDTSTEKKTNIRTLHNTEFVPIAWSPEGDEILFSQQAYKPPIDSSGEYNCGISVHEDNNMKYYLYNFPKNQTRPINTVSEQMMKWYPQVKKYFDKIGKEININDYIGSL